ncbi:uncharacterized protein [Salmo salar]|uniref:Uncharacterized protein LOC106611567 n=1 Tax=Salmo salar TaxID=8030 RepID=A0ABM3F8D0_SALSA|nr:uncharacterized protein LOC106611567 [Salmo salar]XP_045579567.1 uncharacterized protein LOC106611567 [Salmo salar]XP_045579568.1 uncharacterized protein LOC106611567 [Salmo salar]
MASVRVAVRVRPLMKREKEMSATVIIHMEGSTTSIDCNKKHLSKGTPGTGLKDRGRQSFSYDFSYDSTDVGSPNFVPQEKVFKDLGCDVLEAAFDGYNACVFAYGQTGSGKSHTMMGSPGDIGLIPRICEGLFCQISEKSQGDGASFRTEVSYLEIYNERVQDLLTTKKSPENGSGLKVREHPKDGPYVEDLSKHLVQNYRDIEKLLHAGKAKRTTSSTGMNDVSSRSHAIFTINFTQARFDAELPCEMVSKIHLVDLAGSERADATCATGARLKEGANINKSLVTLGIVISALGDGGGSHKGKRKKPLFIPYRDSVLTWLLKDSLGGNSKTIMIATLSPADVNYSDTLSTLHYANRAKNIVNKPTVNEESSVTVIRKLQEEIVRLKGLVEKNNQARLSPQDLSKTLKVEEKLHKNEVKVLELTREWTNKWGETQNILKEGTVALRKQGIGVVMDSKLPHLIGIDDDLLSNGIILYHLKEGRTLVGRDEASSNPDIVLHGAGLLDEHCVFENRDGVVTLIPQTGALCSVNQLETTLPCQLTQGAVIQLGRGTIFRFNHPNEAEHLREQHKSGLLSSLSLTDFSRLFHPGMDVFAVAGENGESRQQRSSVHSPQLQTCTVMTEAMPMEAPVSVSRHPSACYAVPLQIGAGAPQHLQAVSSLHAGVNRWSFGAAEGRERPCSITNEESQRRARASPVHRTGTPTLTSDLTPTALERDSLQQGLEGEVEEWDSCHQSGSGVGVSDRWLEGALRRAREEGGLYWGEEAWSGPGARDKERNRALQQTPVLLVQQADVCTVGPEGLPGPANKSPGVLSGLPDGCRVLGGVLATDCCRRDLSRAGARYRGPAGTSLGTAVSYLQRGDGGGIDWWTEERTDRAHLPQASSSSTYTQTSLSRFDTHTPSVSQLDNHSQATHTASLSQIDTHNDSQATHTTTRQDRHRRSQAVRGLPLEALEGQFSRVMMDRSRTTVKGHRENNKEGEAGARREEVEQNFRLGALVSRVFREEEERKEELEEENQFSVSGLSAVVRRVCPISGIGAEQELDSLGEELSGMGSLVSRGLSWMFPDIGCLLRSSTPRILQQIWDGTGVLQPAAGGGAGSLQPGAGGGASSNWSSQVVSIVGESRVLSVVKDSQVFSLVRESHVYSLVRDSQVFSMVSELPFVHHISTELTQDFGIIHNELTQVLQPVASTGLQQKAIDLNTTPEIKQPLVHNTVLSTVTSLYPAHNTIEFANKRNTGKEVDWRAEEQSPIRELACTSEQEGGEEALAKFEQSPVRGLACTSEHDGGDEALAKSEEPSPIRELECTLEGGEEALAVSEEQIPIRELACTSENKGGEEALAKSKEPSPIREVECTSEQEAKEEDKSVEQCPIRELACTSENKGGEEALAKSEERSPIREQQCTTEHDGGDDALAKSEEPSPIRELKCTLEQEGGEKALAISEEQSPIRELACTSENKGREEALAKSEPSPIREVEYTSEQEGREEALPKLEEQIPIRELACTSENKGGEEALAKSKEPSPIREVECTSEQEVKEEDKSEEQCPIRELACTSENKGGEEALPKSEERSPIREQQCTTEHQDGEQALAKSERTSPIREVEYTSEREGREEALAKLEEQSPIREQQCTTEHEDGEEALAKSEKRSTIRELACTSEHEDGEEALAKSEEPSPIRELECISEQEGREEALAKSVEPSPIRELKCTLEQEGGEEALAISEEQIPIRELACTSEHEGGEEALAKSTEQSIIRELACTTANKGGEEALAKSEEPSPIREVECTSEQEGREEALPKLEEQSPVRELECTSEQEGREEALAKSEERSPIREQRCTTEHDGGDEALAKSEEPSPIRELECTLEGGEEALAVSEEQIPIRELACTSENKGGEEALAKSKEPSPIREVECTSEQEAKEEDKSVEQCPIRELACTSENKGGEEALAKSEERSPIREQQCTTEHDGGDDALAKSEEPSPIRELKCTLEQEGGEKALAISEEQSPIRELACTSENKGREEALAKSEPSPIREVEYTSEQEGREEALPKLEEQIPIRELACTSENKGGEEALAKSKEPSPIREVECTSEQEVKEEDKSEEQCPIRELACTSENKGGEEALPKSEERSPIREQQCTTEHQDGEQALAKSERTSPIREVEYTSEREGREEALAKLEEQSPIREQQCTTEHDGGEDALAKLEEQSPIRELECTSEQEGREEALAKSVEPSPIRELKCTLEQEGGEEALAISEEQIPIRELACTSEHEGGEEALAKSTEQSIIRELACTTANKGGEEALAKSEEQSPIRELECTSEGREEALAKSEEPSPIRELKCTLEQEGGEKALAISEEQSPIRELACTSENKGREEALAKSEPSPIREVECTSEQEGGEEALAKLEEQSPIRELACTSEHDGGDEALAKSEEPSPIREVEYTSEHDGGEEALAKSEEQSPITELEFTSEHKGGGEAIANSEEPSPIRELECTSEQEGREEVLVKSEEQSITKEALWPSRSRSGPLEDQRCVTCGAKSTKSQAPPEQHNNTSSTSPENIFIPGHGNQRTDDVQVYYGSLVEFPGALVKLQSLPVSTLLGCLQSVLPSVFTSRRLLALYWLGVANCSQPHPHLALVLLLESCLYALTFDPDMPDQTTSLTVFHHLPLLQVKEILVGFCGQSLRLKASSEECVLTLYTHSQTLTQALTHTLLGVLCPGDQRVSQHPLLVENLMVLSLDWKAQAPDLLLNAELRLSGQFHKTLADLVYLVHGNMNRQKPHLGQVRLLLYTSVGVITTPDPRPDPWAQLLLTDTHLGLVQEDTVFHPVPLLSRQAQFKGVTLRCLSDVRCVIVRDGVGCSTSVGGDGAGDEGGATRLDIILSQDWRTRKERPGVHPERGAEADGSAVGVVVGASVLSAASNSCPLQQAEVWKLHFSCSSEAACLINHLSNV